MPSLNRDLLFGNPELPISPTGHHRVPIHVSIHPGVIRVSEPDCLRHNIPPFHSLPHNLAVITIYKQILLPHIIQYPKLRIRVILKFIIIPIQMIRCNIRQYRRVTTELEHPVQLKTRQLHHVHPVQIVSHLCRQTIPHIPGQSHVIPGLLQYMIQQQSSSSFPVTPRDTIHLRIRVPSRKLDLGNHLDSLLPQSHDHRQLIRNTRTLHHQICGGNAFFRVLPLFILYPQFLQHTLILVGQLPLVRQKNLIPQLLS